MTQFEIHDDEKVLFRGSPVETMRIWELLLAGKKNSTGTFKTDNHLIPFKAWRGSIRIVSIIDEIHFKAESHTIF